MENVCFEQRWMNERLSGHKARIVIVYFEKSNRFESKIQPRREFGFPQIVSYKMMIWTVVDLYCATKTVATELGDGDEEMQTKLIPL